MLTTTQFTIDPVPLVATISNLTVDGKNVYFDISCESCDRIKQGGYYIVLYVYKGTEPYRYSYYDEKFDVYHDPKFYLDPGNYTVFLNICTDSYGRDVIKTLASQDFTVNG